MNKIIPFNKELKFNEEIGEITNIAVDDNLKFKDSYTITGDLTVRGTHKYGDIEEDFSFPIPTLVTVDDKYDTSKTTIMLDDFFYEIINNDTLKVKIDLILDNLSFKENKIDPVQEEVLYEKEEINEANDVESIPDLLNETNLDKDYSVYRVYVVQEGDSLNKILEKYHINSEELAHYNTIENIKPGDKLVIPSVDE